MAAARSARPLSLDEIREIREALAHRRAAGQTFEQAWSAVLRGLPPRQREQLRHDVEEWRAGFERRGGTAIAALVGVLEERKEQGRTVVLG